MKILNRVDPFWGEDEPTKWVRFARACGLGLSLFPAIWSASLLAHGLWYRFYFGVWPVAHMTPTDKTVVGAIFRHLTHELLFPAGLLGVAYMVWVPVAFIVWAVTRRKFWRSAALTGLASFFFLFVFLSLDLFGLVTWWLD